MSLYRLSEKGTRLLNNAILKLDSLNNHLPMADNSRWDGNVPCWQIVQCTSDTPDANGWYAATVQNYHAPDNTWTDETTHAKLKEVMDRQLFNGIRYCARATYDVSGNIIWVTCSCCVDEYPVDITISADQTDWSLSLDAYNWFRVTPSGADRTINSIHYNTNKDAIKIEITNAGSNNLTLKHNGSGSAGNKMYMSDGLDRKLVPNETATLKYDATKNGWREVDNNALTPTSGSGSPGSSPTSGCGKLYYDCTNKDLYAWNGSSWQKVVSLTAGAGISIGESGGTYTITNTGGVTLYGHGTGTSAATYTHILDWSGSGGLSVIVTLKNTHVANSIDMRTYWQNVFGDSGTFTITIPASSTTTYQTMDILPTLSFPPPYSLISCDVIDTVATSHATYSYWTSLF